jgi:hypothetical protein
MIAVVPLSCLRFDPLRFVTALLDMCGFQATHKMFRCRCHTFANEWPLLDGSVVSFVRRNFAVRAQQKTSTRQKDSVVKLRLVVASAFVATLAMPLAAQAQGVPGGAAHGFNEGGRIAGQVGAVVGGAVGGVIGGIEGVLGIPPRYQPVEYSEPPRKSYRKYRKVRHARRR